MKQLITLELVIQPYAACYLKNPLINAYNQMCIMFTCDMRAMYNYVLLVLIWLPDHDESGCLLIFG